VPRRVQSAPPRDRREENRSRAEYKKGKYPKESRDKKEEHSEQPARDQGSRHTKRKKEESPKKARKHKKEHSKQQARDQRSRQAGQPKDRRKDKYSRDQEASRDQEEPWQEVKKRSRKEGKRFRKRQEIRKDKDEVLPLDKFLKEGNIQQLTSLDFAKIMEKLIKYFDGKRVEQRATKEGRWTLKALQIRGSEGKDGETLYGFDYEKVEEPVEEGTEVQEEDMKSIPENIAQLAQQIFETYCVKSKAASRLVFNLKANCDTWMEGFKRLEGEIKEQAKEDHAGRPKVEEFLRTAGELVERMENSMFSTHIIVTTIGEVTGERLTDQFEGHTRVAEE
jgi:hypothetical protein